ncbi:MAG TPA: hypothetical protein VM598_11095, partial [Bdellovibrionota bacterium]|nr:hypothetical protein [Bdellovibrionota bacterium]
MKSLSLRPLASFGLFALLLTSQQALALGRPKPNPTPTPTPTPTVTPSPVPPPCSTAGDRVDPAEDEWVVSLKADNGKYMVAECGGDDVGIVNANRDTTGGWETFYIKELGGGEASIRSNHGRYLAAESGGGEALHANRTSIGVWERFRLEGSLG